LFLEEASTIEVTFASIDASSKEKGGEFVDPPLTPPKKGGE